MLENDRQIIVNGYAYPTINNETLDDWLDELTLISSFSYGFKPDGSLLPLDDGILRIAAEEENVGVMMVMTALDDSGSFSSELVHYLLTNNAAQTKLIQNILVTLREKNMFGVDFDFEFIFAEDRQHYVDFITEAAQTLNAEGFLVTAAVAPKQSADQRGLLYEGHDYEGLGQAANFVLLMTYEWGYTYGPPLPVAPLPSVRRVLDYGVSAISPDKILMGMPNYGYDWKLPFVQGESVAEKLSHNEAVARAGEYGVPVQFDMEFMSPYYYYHDSNGDEHVVWFEDERSWKAKLGLVREYGLAGIGIWNIMSDFEGGIEAIDDSFEVLKV